VAGFNKLTLNVFCGYFLITEEEERFDYNQVVLDGQERKKEHRVIRGIGRGIVIRGAFAAFKAFLFFSGHKGAGSVCFWGAHLTVVRRTRA
jgi:hypothetical protein